MRAKHAVALSTLARACELLRDYTRAPRHYAAARDAYDVLDKAEEAQHVQENLYRLQFTGSGDVDTELLRLRNVLAAQPDGSIGCAEALIELSGRARPLRARPPSDMGHRGPRTIHVPPGHYPPPGECRVWYPDRPPGHQPSPGSCHHLHAGHGAFVLYNGHAWDADYDWRRYARRHPGTVPKVIIKIKSR